MRDPAARQELVDYYNEQRNKEQKKKEDAEPAGACLNKAEVPKPANDWGFNTCTKNWDDFSESLDKAAAVYTPLNSQSEPAMAARASSKTGKDWHNVGKDRTSTFQDFESVAGSRPGTATKEHPKMQTQPRPASRLVL